ncbi:MAG TPA: hypothetical protein VN948_24175 [Terriglobales bacterium]|nr:hypothetical protein [Terriglobales bacterium]
MQKWTIFGLLATIILAVAASAPGQTFTLLAKFHHKSDGAAPMHP